MSWDKLSMAEKAEVMRLAVQGGIYDLDAIRNGYNEYAKGGKIHIAPSKRGTFTAAASKHGKSVQAFASQVLAHPENYSPAMRKKANFARNAAKWKHAYGGELGNYYGGFGDFVNSIKSGVKKARQKVKDWGLDKSPGDRIYNALASTANSDEQYRQNLYNSIDPTSDVPSGLDIIGYGLSAIASKFGNEAPYRRVKTDSVADAAWAKRLELPYNRAAIIDNGDGTFRLPASNEDEMPVDTTFLKNRIADNQKLLNQVHGKKHSIVGLAIDADTKALNALRKTYATGEPVEMDEHSYVNRNWNANSTKDLETSPLNVLHRYTMQYDKDNNRMNYWDLYDFNEFEQFVPGKPFKIRGSIDLNKRN